MIDKESGLTEQEEKVSEKLTDAWAAFKGLPVQHSSDKDDFCFGIHLCQGLLMQRIARRKYPKGWENIEKIK